MPVTLFTGLLRSVRPLAPRAGGMIQQRASYIHGKPAKNDIGVVESVFVMTVLTMSVLGPSGWVLAHLEYYKSRG